MKLLVISNVWVEPQSTAAGSRILQLLHIFLEQNWEVSYASTASKSDYAFDLKVLGIATHHIEMNNASFDAFLEAEDPDIVLFDRFMTEEQFGWRIASVCPEAIKILDTEDLHCLRKAREGALKENRSFAESDLISDIALREIASIYRCDLTLMISRFEMELLESFFKVPSQLLMYIPFLLDSLKADFKSYSEHDNFVSIGNFLHGPNWDATLVLKKSIWPLIRKELPKAQLSVYGAYPSDKVMQLHNPKEGFLIKGRADDAMEVISKAKVLLAPLRYGAGLKGKFIDAMQCGTPSVTTEIGAEGMQQGLPWSGEVVPYFEEGNTDFYNAFAKAATALYSNESQWKVAQENGRAIINANFQKSTFDQKFIYKIKTISNYLKSHRLSNFTGRMLQFHTMRSTMFMSKWIEEKNKGG
ncbi:glycosyltransferase [Dokdonia sinensis]|uniref:Glycosyltransferase n=1 Tax=Dokdonia sinensis TaxID=2479847 RepID=A0A3M0G1P7_9FLAO|nr:glycosyltransferase [Dokdonia sinensis]RMB56112.1 glycosyltransferase [Dokdonia sinensis]